MPAIKHDCNGEIDRVAHVLQTGNPTCPEVGAHHDAGVQLDDSVSIQAGADAGVEEGLVFHEPDGGHHGGQRPIADLRPGGVSCPLDGGLPERTFRVGDWTGAAMDDQRRARH